MKIKTLRSTLAICGLFLCGLLRAASLPVSFDSTTHLIAAPLDLWTVNSANIYNGLGLSGMSLQSPSSVSITGGSISGVTGLGYTANPLSQFAATTSSQLQGVISDETGSGALVFGTSPTLTTPSLGVATATSINSTTIPSSKTLVVTTDKLSVHAATTSSELFGVLSDETGSGSVVGSASPTLTGTITIPPGVINSNGMGFGGSPSSTYPIDVTPSVNGAMGLRAYNFSTGTSAYATHVSQTDGGTIELRAYSASNSIWPDTGVITAGSLSGGVQLYQATTGAPWTFHTEGTERFRVLPTGGVTIGTAAANATLFGGAANRLELRNSTAAQQFRAYNTFTDNSNGEWFSIDWQSVANECIIGLVANGTGVATRTLSFYVGGSRRWQINGANNHFLAATDNVYDIGANGANRPRNIYAGTSLVLDSAAWISWATRAQVTSPADSVILLRNNAGTSFDRIQLGGTTASFPALKRSTTTVQAVLADDSGFAAVQSLYDRFGSGSPESAVTAPVGAVYHRTDGGAGTSLYVKESGTGNTGWVAK